MTAETAQAESTEPSKEPAAPGPVPGLTTRSIATGFALAIVLCFMNSYLTLSFGVIEEGPTIAALFFFAIFFVSKLPITTTEMVIVASMGSAGGSLGFISNFFAAKAMTGRPYTLFEMTIFGVISSLVGLVMVIPLRQLLVIREQLPWPGAKATAGVIKALVEEGDPRQPKILLVTTAVAMTVVILNKDGGYGKLPDETAIPVLAAFGGAIAWSPFATAGSYLMGMRTCVGFLVGACTLMVMAKLGWTPDPKAPHKFFWPGLGFLVGAGVLGIVLNWRAFADAFKSIASLGKNPTEVDEDAVLTSRQFGAFAAISFVICAVVLKVFFGVSILLSIILIAVGGFLQNIIATRAAALTAFNPARVMGILIQGVTAAFGGRSAAINLAGAGFVAGSGAQAGTLTNDFAYGRWFRVPSRWQFWLQVVTVLPCSLVAAFAFQKIAERHPMTLDSKLPAPVAKMWAASAQIFDGSQPLPPGALKALIIGAAVGVAYVLVERIKGLEKYLPESTGVGLGLVLSVSYGLTFFVGGFIMWIVLARRFAVREVTLTTIAIGCIVAEGIGGVAKPLLTIAGLNPQ
ncbi:MAG: OPT/YSL family transporter [Myxococcales bacterium]|nr:OPT/YSL family transporter [Myxococcales bacterium]